MKAVAERPILFSGPMVRAILEGRKTQTRRVLKPQPVAVAHGRVPPALISAAVLKLCPVIECPYGVPGDRLWVREGWAQQHPLALRAGRYSQDGQAGIPGPPRVAYRVCYRADGEPLQVWRREGFPYFGLEKPSDSIDLEHPTVCSNFTRAGKAIYWNNPRFMPRWASRLTLEVTDVRVQRVQEISEQDCIAEGSQMPMADLPPGCKGAALHEIDVYARLWNHINAKRGFGWDANPWVWAITFRRCQ